MAADPEDLTRREVYQGLLKAMGNYRFVDGSAAGDRYTHALDEHPIRPVVDWVMDGLTPRVTAHHVWVVGGGPTPRGATMIKDRHIRWTGEAWDVVSEEVVENAGYSYYGP